MIGAISSSLDPPDLARALLEKGTPSGRAWGSFGSPSKSEKRRSGLQYGRRCDSVALFWALAWELGNCETVLLASARSARDPQCQLGRQNSARNLVLVQVRALSAFCRGDSNDSCETNTSGVEASVPLVVEIRPSLVGGALRSDGAGHRWIEPALLGSKLPATQDALPNARAKARVRPDDAWRLLRK